MDAFDSAVVAIANLAYVDSTTAVQILACNFEVVDKSIDVRRERGGRHTVIQIDLRLYGQRRAVFVVLPEELDERVDGVEPVA